MLAEMPTPGRATVSAFGRALSWSVERKRPVILASLAAFFFALCCLPTHAAKFLVVPALLVGAAASVANARRRVVLRDARDLQFLLFAFVWTLMSGIASDMRAATIAALLSNVVLLVCLALVVRGVCLAGLQRHGLGLMTGFTVLGGVLSVAAQLQDGQGLERLGSVALNGMIIPAAGGYACAVLAVIAMWRTTSVGRVGSAVLGLALLVLLLALAWGQSRGPLVALAVALLSIPVAGRFNGRFGLAAACLVAFAATSSAILFENQIHAVLCASNLPRMCDPSKRLELWGWAVDAIASHPLFGVGFGNYFADEHRPHPHNGLIALAFFAGLPLLIAFLALSLDTALRLQRAPRSPLALYAAPTLVFGFGYMGTDLANAVGFIGTHYLFLWIPIFTAYSDGVARLVIARGAATKQPDCHVAAPGSLRSARSDGNSVAPTSPTNARN